MSYFKVPLGFRNGNRGKRSGDRAHLALSLNTSVLTALVAGETDDGKQKIWNTNDETGTCTRGYSVLRR